jgi:broad specificity phosphatase PhoE
MHIPEFRVKEALLSRHPKSLANHAQALAKKGDHSLLRAISHLSDREFDLVDEGVAQVRAQALWLKKHGLVPADVHITSGYYRAQRAAQEMQLPGVVWHADERLNERDWGSFGALSASERDERFPGWKVAKEADPLNWQMPGGGETLQLHYEQFGDAWHDINSRYPNKRIFLIGHGEKWAVAQMYIEALSPSQFARHERDLRLENCHLVHYKRGADGHVHKRRIDPFHATVTEWHVVSPLTV